MIEPTSNIQSALDSELAHATASTVQINGLALMAGGASQEMWRLDVSVADGPWQGDHALVMRRQLGGKIHSSALDLAGEFNVLQAVYGCGAPVPRPYWFLPDLLGRSSVLMQRLDGETIGRKIVKEPALAEARRLLPAQMGTALAAIHRIDVDAQGLRDVLPSSAPGQTPAQAYMAEVERDLDRAGEPHPAIELCLRWLRRNEPPQPDRLVLVHGDFRLGNMMVGPQGLVGVLDWEFAHLGDPAEDLIWPLVREWRFGADQLHFGGVGQPEAFFAAYSQNSGSAKIDAQRVLYWEVMGNIRWAVGTLNQAQRHLSGEAPNLEFASLGRRCAEMELEALLLIKNAAR